MYEIEKNIPVPAKRGPLTIYPFDQMGKGDSFFIPTKTQKETKSKRRSVAGRALKKNVKVATRIVEGGVRVWRVE